MFWPTQEYERLKPCALGRGVRHPSLEFLWGPQRDKGLLHIILAYCQARAPVSLRGRRTSLLQPGCGEHADDLCPRAYLRNQVLKLHRNNSVCHLWPWLCLFLAVLRYVSYFRFR